ncbi:MBL fold metallo-hydrolase [Undibacterium fentianense]|uniref:MBL fold metallo-hydrolase n=1 Tax=Undibacterium fentianense TaxID=2828728 RepID=A0A941E2G6_9BURK|nr:MBL fold metallo-hydrolase [Undibacterium fentianense]MBR7801130.1 MBL fold metallo-hydrolase [Undibacterium fentianense]
MKPQIQHFFDPRTFTATYLVFDVEGGHAAVIDPVLDYDPKSGRTKTESADQILAALKQHHLQLDWILETHAHADHFSGAHYLQKEAGGKIAIGARINQVQSVFKKLFHLEPELAVDGSQFDHLFQADECFQIGQLQAQALFVPGHTPADIAYKIDDAIFVGDTLFMPDVGTARCDFPGGDARMLYASIQRLLSFPDDTRLFMCHDYPPKDREVTIESNVRAQKEMNIHVHQGIDENAFVAMRTQRDAGLEMPVLILPAIQINIRAGNPPPPEANGISYLKIPLNAL